MSKAHCIPDGQFGFAVDIGAVLAIGLVAVVMVVVGALAVFNLLP